MDYKVLYRKYRPRNFEEVIGQEYTINMLKNAFLENKISHANIFTGPRGTGKTSTAKLLAKLINCEHPINGNPCEECSSCTNYRENPDIIEIDAASNNGVDQIRELINNVKIAPSYSKYKVYIIDEVHMLTPNAFNAFLLTLEEPPKNIIFIMATTEIQSVPITILSRCQRFDFNRLNANTVYEQLKKVSVLEKINIEDDAIKEISSICEGGMRDAYSILDQISNNNKVVTVEDVYHMFGSISNNSINELIDDIISNNVSNIISTIDIFKKSSTNYLNIVDKLIYNLNERAKQIKLGNNLDNIDFYKDLIMELAKIYNNKSIVNPYLIIEVLLLNYAGKNDRNYFPGNNLNIQISSKKENISPVINSDEIEEKKLDNISDIEKLISIRINNTFVEANKKSKENIINLYNEFISKADDYILNMIQDTEIVAASDKYAIILSSKDSTAQIINDNISSIEEQFIKKENLNIKFIALSKDRWNKEKKLYKKENKYEYIDDSFINKISTTIFDNSIIEIK